MPLLPETQCSQLSRLISCRMNPIHSPLLSPPQPLLLRLCFGNLPTCPILCVSPLFYLLSLSLHYSPGFAHCRHWLSINWIREARSISVELVVGTVVFKVFMCSDGKWCPSATLCLCIRLDATSKDLGFTLESTLLQITYFEPVVDKNKFNQYNFNVGWSIFVLWSHTFIISS